MKTLLTRFSSFCLLMVAGFLFFACGPQTGGPVDPGTENEFSLTVKNIGADFVELEVSAPSQVEMAYVVDKEPMALSPAVLFASGTTKTVTHGDILKVNDGIVPETSYYLYAVAKLDAKNYSRVLELEFLMVIRYISLFRRRQRKEAMSSVTVRQALHGITSSRILREATQLT